MGAVWIIVGTAIVGVVVKWIVWHRERRWESGLGFVSQQWIAEHRASHLSARPR